jgi:hypothetical protein
MLDAKDATPGKPAVKADDVLRQHTLRSAVHLPPAQPLEGLAILADQAPLPSSTQGDDPYVLQRMVCTFHQ